MEVIDRLVEGFGIISSVGVLVPMFLGVLTGSIVGVLPGIGPIGAMALLLPLTFTLDPTAGILMMAGIYYGSMYGGSTTSILVRVPGEASSVITSLDGHEMTKRGRAGAALAVAAIGSFIAGTLAIAALMFAAPTFAEVALRFAAPEYFALTLFAMLVLSRLISRSFVKTMVAVAFGLALGTVGFDNVSGNARFTFGFFELTQGVNLTALAVGLYGVAEVFLLAERKGKIEDLPKVRLRELYPTRKEFRRALPPMFRGGALGFLLGLIPGPAGVTSTYASYALEHRLSKRKEEFGKGAIEGVAGPEAANNGAAGGAMVPLLLLGIPFAPAAAMLLAGFTIHGVIPGPTFISGDPELFWGLIAGFYVANLALLVLNYPLVTAFTSLLRIPRDVLLTAILILAVVGTYATRNTIFDVIVLIAMGVVGYFMQKAGMSRAALLLAFVIGDLMEQSLLQTLTLARGQASYLLDRPIASVILGVTLAVVLIPTLVKAVGGRLHGVMDTAGKGER